MELFFKLNFAYTVLYNSRTVLYRCLHMVCIYYNGIEIPSFQILHIQFYMVPIQFFTDAYTWYAYTKMALISPHSRFCTYGSRTVLYRCLHMVCMYYNGIEIPSFQILHIWFYTFFTDAYTWYAYTIMALISPHSRFCIYGSIRFPYGSLQMPTHGMHIL